MNFLLVQYILLYFICNSMYVVCMWRVSSILLLYLLDLESVNKNFDGHQKKTSDPVLHLNHALFLMA